MLSSQPELVSSRTLGVEVVLQRRGQLAVPLTDLDARIEATADAVELRTLTLALGSFLLLLHAQPRVR